MKTKSGQFLFAIALLACTGLAFSQSENPFIGTWDLDKNGSSFGNIPVPKTMTRTYSDLGTESYMYLLVIINQDDSLGGSSATYRFDKMEYPMATLNQNTPTTISYEKINEKTVQYTVRVNGRVSQIGAKTISPDGRVLTIAIQTIGLQGEINNQILKFNRRT